LDKRNEEVAEEISHSFSAPKVYRSRRREYLHLPETNNGEYCLSIWQDSAITVPSATILKTVKVEIRQFCQLLRSGLGHTISPL
jgi:hypothetical protein